MGPLVGVKERREQYLSRIASHPNGKVHSPGSRDRVRRNTLGQSYSLPNICSTQTSWELSATGVWIAQKPNVTSSKHCASVSGSSVSVSAANHSQLHKSRPLSSTIIQSAPQPPSPVDGKMQLEYPGVLKFAAPPNAIHTLPTSTSSKHWSLFDVLPMELLQFIMGLLPTFGGRKRFCLVCKMASSTLEWRLAPPLPAFEEMSCLNLGELGVCAVATAFARPQHSFIGELSLGNNNFGDKGAFALAALIKAGCAIRRLSLRDNAIGDAGAHALAEALAVNTKMEELDLWGNKLTDSGKAVLASTKCKVFVECDVAQPQPAAWAKLDDGRIRTILFEWISQIQTGTHGALNEDADPQDLLFRTYSIIDGYYGRKAMRESELQLVGVACTFAATTHSIQQTDEDLAAWLAAVVTNGIWTPDHIREAASKTAKVLGFKMNAPTAYNFLRRYQRKTGWTQESFNLANYLIELAVLDNGFAQYSPQAIAAAATVLSRQYLSQGIKYQKIHCWKEKLLRCACLDVATELAPCTAALARLHASEQGRTDRFVNRKYMWQGLHMVAKIKPNPPVDAAHFVAYLTE